MSSPPEGPVEACLIDLFQQLGLDKAHIVAGRLGLTDWHGCCLRPAFAATNQCTTEQGVGRILACPALRQGHR